MLPWAGPIAEGNLNALMAVQDYAPPLFAAEHSAAVTEEDREKAEDGFMNRTPPRPNLLACTPTLEMGVNIGDLEAVAMRNIPPSPANYAQRSGRTGRVSRMGIVAGFSRNTPHDGYFFDHPGEIISGAIPPPRFNLDNLEAIARHVRSLVLEHAELDIPHNLANYLTEKGQPIEPAIQEPAHQDPGRGGTGRRIGAAALARPAGRTDGFFEAIAAAFPEQVKATLVERGKLLAQAAEEVRKLGEKIKLTPKEEQAQNGLPACSPSASARTTATPTCPASWPRPGCCPATRSRPTPAPWPWATSPSRSSAGDSRPSVSSPRARSSTRGAAGGGDRRRTAPAGLARRGPDQSMFKFTLCGSCGLANRPNLNFCARCQAPIGDDDGAGLATFTAWDASAFQAWESEVAADSEEDRMMSAFDIRPHPQLDRDGIRYRIGPWALDLRSQEEIWFINHGLKEVGTVAEDRASSPGFVLCSAVRRLLRQDRAEEAGQGRQAARGRRGPQDARAALGPHAKRCNGTPDHFSLGHKRKADTLRLVVPDPASSGTRPWPGRGRCFTPWSRGRSACSRSTRTTWRRMS